jgi:hypothetical protein
MRGTKLSPPPKYVFMAWCSVRVILPITTQNLWTMYLELSDDYVASSSEVCMAIMWWGRRQVLEHDDKLSPSHCLIKHHALKTYWGRGSFAPRILNLDNRWSEWPASRFGRLPQGKKSPVRRLGGYLNWSGHGGEKKNVCPCWESIPDLPARSLVTQLQLWTPKINFIN